MKDLDIVKGDDGRIYKRREDGRLQELPDPEGHAKRQLASITSKHTVTGVRIVDLDKPDDPAVVVTMDEKEAKPVVAVIKAVLAARAKG